MGTLTNAYSASSTQAIAAPAAHAAGELSAVQPADPSICWRVLQTRSRQEKLVAQAAESAGLRCCLPLVEKVRVYRRSKRKSLLPLFPSYVFAYGGAEGVYSVAASDRVARIIEVHDQDLLETELSQIRTALEVERSLDPWPFLKKGRRARVIGGPFKGIEGVVEDRPRPDRLILQIQSLGRATSLEIEPSLLESAD